MNTIFEPDPDVVFAVETDEWWCSLLADALRSRYPFTLDLPPLEWLRSGAVLAARAGRANDPFSG